MANMTFHHNCAGCSPVVRQVSHR